MRTWILSVVVWIGLIVLIGFCITNTYAEQSVGLSPISIYTLFQGPLPGTPYKATISYFDEGANRCYISVIEGNAASLQQDCVRR